MSESAYLSYYQKNRSMILNRAKENKPKVNIKTYLKKKKMEIWKKKNKE